MLTHDWRGYRSNALTCRRSLRREEYLSDFDEFKSYHALADQLTQAMVPEQLADCLRILALHVADYRLRFGEIP